MPVVMDAERISRALTRIAHEILEHNRGLSNLALVGVRSRGVPIAQRIADDLRKISGEDLSVGALDITLYRDDLMGASVGIAPMVRKTEIPFSIDGRTIVLVDDVLYTGRTTRAALDALTDFGRPKSIQLVVLVDRGITSEASARHRRSQRRRDRADPRYRGSDEGSGSAHHQEGADAAWPHGD